MARLEDAVEDVRAGRRFPTPELALSCVPIPRLGFPEEDFRERFLLWYREMRNPALEWSTKTRR